ncbi:MAG: hypothetical protein M3Q70_01965 [bacterium]|nr:hypothetical protein [bacterium]
MTRFLQNLRYYDSSTSQMLQALEELSGRQSFDIKLSTELQRILYDAVIKLGLDPKDTDARELYQALQSKMASDENLFLKELKLTLDSSQQKYCDALAGHLNHTFASKTVLVPKHAVLKKILKANPPKSALKLLHYRSLESCLRRCPLPIIFAACELTEPRRWRLNFITKLDKLESNDFEIQKIEFHSVDVKQWGALHDLLLKNAGHTVFRVNVCGGIVLVPSDKTISSGLPTLYLMASLSALSKLRANSSFTPRILLDASVPTSYSQHIYDKDDGSVIVRSVHFSWRDIHHRMDNDPQLINLFEPHINKKSVNGDDMQSLIKSVAKCFFWWESLLATGYYSDGQVVSCNLYDVARNAVFKRNLGAHTIMAFSRELDFRLRRMYLTSEQLSNRIYEQLSASSAFDSEPLMLELDELEMGK